MIIKKKRINSLSCLNHVEEGKNLMMVLRDAARFKGILVKLGFSEDLIEGERVLPSMLNPTLKRNAEPFYIKDKTKPKEQYTQTLWWTRHEWAGRGETREVTDFVTIPRERYARIKFEPYSVELFLKYDEQGQLMVMTDFISFQFNIDLHIDTYTSAQALLTRYRESTGAPYQLLFLDIEMPDGSGITLADVIKRNFDHHVMIVFVSNYPKYMQDSFAVHPYHFLQKPVQEVEMKQLISDILEEYTKNLSLISVVDGYDREYTLNLKDVYYIKVKNAKSKELCFHMREDTIPAKGTITTWSSMLDETMFMMCSRTVLVNLSHIHYLKDCSIIFDNGATVSMSRRNRKLITDRYLNQVVAMHSDFYTHQGV